MYKYYGIPHYCTVLLIPKSVSCVWHRVFRTVVMKCKIITYRFKKFFTVHLQWQPLMIMFLVILPYFMVEKILLVLECFWPTCNIQHCCSVLLTLHYLQTLLIKSQTDTSIGWFKYTKVSAIKYVSIISILQPCQAVQTHKVSSSPSAGFQYQNLAYGGTVGHRNADEFEPPNVTVRPLILYWILQLRQLHDIYCSKWWCYTVSNKMGR